MRSSVGWTLGRSDADASTSVNANSIVRLLPRSPWGAQQCLCVPPRRCRFPIRLKVVDFRGRSFLWSRFLWHVPALDVSLPLCARAWTLRLGVGVGVVCIHGSGSRIVAVVVVDSIHVCAVDDPAPRVSRSISVFAALRGHASSTPPPGCICTPRGCISTRPFPIPRGCICSYGVHLLPRGPGRIDVVLGSIPLDATWETRAVAGATWPMRPRRRVPGGKKRTETDRNRTW